MAVSVHPDDQVVLSNNTDKPLKFMANGRLHQVDAGGKRAVPFEVMRIWFGDPRSGPTERLYQDEQGRKIRIPSRKAELKRLAVLYGTEASTAQGREDAEREHKAIPPPVELSERVPDVSFEDLGGNPIKHVTEDPEGTAQAPVITNFDNPEEVSAELARLKQQVSKMEERQEAFANLPTPDEEVTEDGPDYTPGK